MSWEGLEGLDLAGVEVSQQKILGPGKHIVTITDAKVVSNENTKTHQLELSYENSDGNLRQWIVLNHPTSEMAVKIGKEQLKKLLLMTGHDGEAAPSPDYFKGKAVGIGVKEEVYNNKTRTKVNYHYEAPKPTEGAELDDAIPF
jgi:hypothetical protein